MPIEAAIDLKRCDLKNVKQVLRRPMTLLVTLYWLTIGLTCVRAGLTYKSLRTHAHKHYVFPSQGGGVRVRILLRTLYVYALSNCDCVRRLRAICLR